MGKNIVIRRSTVILAILMFALGFIVSRLTIGEQEVKTKTVIKYEKQPSAVHDTIYEPKPYAEYIDSGSIHYISLPGKPIEPDTAAILADYLVRRKYNLDFSNDTLGVFKVDAEVTQNHLVNAVSTIQPIIRTVETERTIYKQKKLQFWGMFGTSPKLDFNKVQIGLDLKEHYMIGVSGYRIDNKYDYTIDFGYKF
jgi:hypothetical protein